jgi:anion-transporting  ArsA/GET3 family ATPase
MLQELATKTNLAQVGEEIGMELGTQMVKRYQETNPTDVKSYLIGRNIIEEILAQPRCAAIKFYNATNEAGQKTLVYVGVDFEGKAIVKYSTVNNEGRIERSNGIVADRVKTCPDEQEWWITD